ncbi:hypothetical protein BJ170DRAFT_691946 [Xylariales sp. AK1849]|nr:hypothetical protein BJ170DRAFT_691946 [Xylariales sp. AK1849]
MTGAGTEVYAVPHMRLSRNPFILIFISHSLETMMLCLLVYRVDVGCYRRSGELGRKRNGR